MVYPLGNMNYIFLRIQTKNSFLHGGVTRLDGLVIRVGSNK